MTQEYMYPPSERKYRKDQDFMALRNLKWCLKSRRHHETAPRNRFSNKGFYIFKKWPTVKAINYFNIIWSEIVVCFLPSKKRERGWVTGWKFYGLWQQWPHQEPYGEMWSFSECTVEGQSFATSFSINRPLVVGITEPPTSWVTILSRSA